MLRSTRYCMRSPPFLLRFSASTYTPTRRPGSPITTDICELRAGEISVRPGAWPTDRRERQRTRASQRKSTSDFFVPGIVRALSPACSNAIERRSCPRMAARQSRVAFADTHRSMRDARSRSLDRLGLAFGFEVAHLRGKHGFPRAGRYAARQIHRREEG